MSPQRRHPAVLAALGTVAAAALVVAGIGLDRLDDEGPAGGDGRFDDYCSTVVEHRPLIAAALESGPTSGLIRALPSFRALAAEAPDDIADDWSRVIGAVAGLQEALEDAGLDPETYDRSAPPAGLSRADREAIDAAATALGAPATARSLATVEQQARDVCGSPLSL